jgi:L-fuculose-phosphate aldolase
MSLPPVSARESLVRYYRWLRQHGLNDSHSGNASVRDGELVWMTPTGCGADTLTTADLLGCRPGQSPPAGASLDAPLHMAVYAARAGAGAVLHAHCPHAIAMTLADGDFEPADFEGRYYFGTVPVLDVAPDDYVSESPARVAAALATHRVCLVRGHGAYAADASLDLAYKWLCSLESSARIAWLARAAGIGS